MTIIEKLKHSDNQAAMVGKWIHVFDEVKVQFINLPVWAQEILIDDISAALQNRLLVMQKANNNSRAM
jgi:hypothetical protein